MKPSGIGGMAVIEGVMMKNKDSYAVAVRKPDQEIVVDKQSYKGLASVGIFKIPFLRGVASFLDSMILGVKVIGYAASFFEDEEPEKDAKKAKNSNDNEKDASATTEETADGKNKNANQKNAKQASGKNASSKNSASNNKKNSSAKGNQGAKNKNAKANANGKKNIKNSTSTQLKGKTAATKKVEKKESEGVGALFMALTVMLSLVLSISIFVILPFFLSQLLAKSIPSTFVQGLIEGAIRVAIFIGYVLIVSQMKDIKRMFMYHGAEHKSINCIENGFELTVENVKWQSKQHKRCGTSFMLYVMFLSVLVFSVIRVDVLWLRIVYRLLLLPVIAGISYEFIRLAGSSNSKIMNALSKPGFLMQGLTTKEPDEDMIEVAIASVEAVFDWRAFLADNEKKTTKTVVKEEANEVMAATKEKASDEEEEDDEILAALDKYLDNDKESHT